jgi:hypothetical protein
MYPFANDRYRNIFRHTLWMLPGVKAAKAMSKMLRNHPVFGNFEIVNVAGNGDEDEENSEALKMVNEAIGKNPDETRTITLSCGRLTTGVSVKPWMGVLMLSGSFNTAASAYMQTIFRVQTPFTCNGKVKEDCYVFDFAPDRTLKVLAETAKISTKAGKQGESERRQLGEFLNFCPIISIEGSKMAAFDVDHMLQQLKSVYVERVVRNGFEDGSLYNDKLLKLSDIDIAKFEKLKKIIGQTKAMAKTSDITVNDQGLNNEEYEEKEKIEKKPKKERTPEEQARLDELKQKKEGREKAISILRGISIRMPLLIYGATITDEDKQLTIDNFTSLVDDPSWEEFMPKDVTKDIFREFKSYYDQDIFAAAGKRIRAMARAADNLTIEERIERITDIFATFRNPDKETVLTPWRVVNMHMGDCLGGYVFFEEDNETPLLEPRYVERNGVTDNVFESNTHLLEINSKTGLYPLYLAYNVYRRRLSELTKSPETLKEHQAIWDKVLEENIYVICKTAMAKSITRRTLYGFRSVKTNMWAPDDLINKIKNQPELFIKKVHDLIGKNVKINAIVGNPPYQAYLGGASPLPVYQYFVDIAKCLSPEYFSLIFPSRWMQTGNGLDEFRKNMLHDVHIQAIHDYMDATDCFSNVEIKGGVQYLLWGLNHSGDCTIVTHKNGETTASTRALLEDGLDVYIRDNNIISIIQKISKLTDRTFSSIISSRDPFGYDIRQENSFKVAAHKFSLEKTEDADVEFYYNGWRKKGIGYVSLASVNDNTELVDKYKVLIPKAWGVGNPNKDRLTPFVVKPHSVCTETYLVAGAFTDQLEAQNVCQYISTKFFHIIVSILKISQNAAQGVYRLVPLQDFTPQSDIDWSKNVADIDQQLYTKYGLTDEEIAFIESTVKPIS